MLNNPHASPVDLPPAPSPDEARERWGTRELSEEIIRTVYRSMAGDELFLAWHADYLRFAASPSAAAEFFRMVARRGDVTVGGDHAFAAAHLEGFSSARLSA